VALISEPHFFEQTIMLDERFINLDAIRLNDDSSSKKRVLEHAAKLLSRNDSDLANDIFDRLLERERLGSTGLAGGVALPHARMPGIENTRGAFIRLDEGVDFDALDQQPVDLIFALMVPEDAPDTHLQILAKLAALFGDATKANALRKASPEGALDLLQHVDA
jgi:PTS system nitrogen regulatory IIA component